MNKIKLAIIGVTGRMGLRILKNSYKDSAFEIIAGISSGSNQFLGHDLGSLININNIGINLTKDIDYALDHADIIIDFSSSEFTNSLLDNLKIGTRLIIGTTGFNQETKDKMLKLSERNKIFYSANMSIGIGLIANFLKKYNDILKKNYTIKIADIHHIHKKDAPSGTALMLQQALNDINIPIDSQREGEIIGQHEINLSNHYETINITHEAHDRDLFAIGALEIAKWFMEVKENRFYEMEDFLNKELIL